MSRNVQQQAAEAEKFARWEQNEARRRALVAHPLWDAWHAGVKDGDVARAEATPRRYLISRDCGNGHVEALTLKVLPNPQRDFDRAMEAFLPRQRAVRGEGKVEENAAHAGRRAKRDVRLYCKVMGASSLWTLTYAKSQQDRALARRHLTAFVRRVRKLLPDFRYLAVMERQKRGALHWHLATHGLPRTFKVDGVSVKSWNVVRAIWRSVAGEWGGNFDESKGVRKWRREGRAVRAGAIGRYIGKYLAKGFLESELNAHRFSRSDDLDLPRAQRIEFAAETSMRELIELCYAAVGSRVTGSRFDAESEVFFVESDDSGLIVCGPS